jgi:hypothetical protein
MEKNEIVITDENGGVHKGFDKGLKVQAGVYSFNIESELYNRLDTMELKSMWRKEIEQSYIAGANFGFKVKK